MRVGESGIQVLLDNGLLRFADASSAFSDSPYMKSILGAGGPEDDAPQPQTTKPVNKILKAVQANGHVSGSSSDESSDEESESESEDDEDVKAPRKLIEDETRAIGHVDRLVWLHYTKANGGWIFWTIFVLAFVGEQLFEVGETWWLR